MINLLQHTSRDAGSPAGGSDTLAYTSNNTSGSLLIALVRVGLRPAVTTVSDSQGNTWQNADGDIPDATVSNTYAIWYAMGAKAGANTLTFSYTVAGANTMRWIIAEYSGVAVTNALDKHTHAGPTTSTSAASGVVTPSTARQLVIGLIGTGAGKTVTTTGGMTKQDEIPAGATTRLVLQDSIQTPPADINATGTLSSSDTWVAMIATFKALPPPPVRALRPAIYKPGIAR